MQYLKLFEELKNPRKFIEDFYQHRCTKDIYDPDAVGWVSSGSQRDRFNVFLKYIKSGDSLLDYGCGLGDLSRWADAMQKKVDYLGVDIQKSMIKNAKKKYPDRKFKVVDSIHDIKENHDWIVASGVFTVGMNERDVLEFFKYGQTICNKGIMANFIENDKDRISSNVRQTKNHKTLRYTYYNQNLLKKYLSHGLKSELSLINDYSSEDFTLALFNHK